MISVKDVKIESLEDYKHLKTLVHRSCIDDKVIEVLKKHLGCACDKILVEYPYYDEDYLSTYYIHYGQKFHTYDKLCCRLHVLKNEEYCGYIVLRPTTKGTKIGRSLIIPELLIKDQAYLMLHTFKSHVAGNEMVIRSFPWKSQETDISVCAHTAAWTVLRYFGNKFRDYADTTIGKVVEHTRNDWGRKTPSLGLTPVQVSDLFKDYGFSPLIIQQEKDSYYLEELIAYVESGIPTVGFLYPIKHAISIIGHGTIDYALLDNREAVDEMKDAEVNIISHSKLIKELYVMDDNGFPYLRMPTSLPTKESDTVYGLNELKYAVVPLYIRMQLAYSEVYERFRVWRKEQVMDWGELCVCRIYITSAKSLKHEALISSSMNDDLKDVIINLSLSRFVWCIDLSEIGEYKSGLISGRIVIDATAPTLEEDIWLLRHDRKKIEFIDSEDGDRINNNMYSFIETEIEPYELYRNNLKEIDPI